MTQVGTTGTATGVPGSFDALVLVAVGGTLGTGLRWLLGAATGSTTGLNAGAVLANVVGAFALGLLVARLDGPSFSPARRQRLRLFVGTGVLGGFTTYSAFAVHAADLAVDGAIEKVLWQSLAMVAVGLLAAWLGHAAGGHDLGDDPDLLGGEA